MLGLSPHFWSINHGKREFFSVGSLFLRFLSDRRPRSEPERHSSTEELGSSLSILSSDWHSGERSVEGLTDFDLLFHNLS